MKYVNPDYTDKKGNLFIKNDGTTIEIYSGTEVLHSWILNNYSTVTQLFKAMQLESNIEVCMFELFDRTPSELCKFSDIPIVNLRKGEANNDTFYFLYAINSNWHTFEYMYDASKYSRPIVQIDGHGTYVDFYNVDIFNKPIELVFGGSLTGSNCDVSYKDIDIRIENTEDAEMSINTIDGYTIISDESPRVLVYTLHDVPDVLTVDNTEIYSTSLDKLYYVLRLAKENGYQPVTVNDVVEFVKYGKKLPKRSILFIHDDIRLYIYLNKNLLSAYSSFCYPLTLALQNNSKEFTYNGTTYMVADLVSRMRGSHFDVVQHSDHSPSPSTQTELAVWLPNIERSEQINIDATIHVYPGGSTNPMFCEELKSNATKGAFTTTKGKVKSCSYDMRIPRYYVDMIPISQIKNEII